MLRHFQVAHFTGAARWTLLLLAFAVSSWAAPSIDVVLDRSTIGVNESAILNVVFQEGGPSTPPTVPPVGGLTIAYRGQSQKVTLVNQQVQRTISYNFQVQAAQPGQYTIPSVRAVVGAVSLQSKPVTLTVTAAQQSSQPRMAFLRLIGPTRDVYVGEVFPVEVQLLYVAGRGQDIQHPQVTGAGFVIGKRADQPSQTQTAINNVRFQVISFKMTMSAVKSGALSIGPAKLSMSMRVLANQARRNDPFDLFGASEFFGRYEIHPVELESEPLAVNVLPLPDGAPPSFTGAIGKFTISAEASAANVTAGDPITMTTVIEGAGSVDSVTLPKLAWNDFQSYSPNSRVESTDPLELQGRKIFEHAVVPQNASVKEIPAIEFTYFDPEARKFDTIKTDPQPIQVAPSARQSLPVAATDSGQATPTDTRPADIEHIKSRPGTFVSLASINRVPPWIFALQALPILAFLAAFAYRKREDKIRSNPHLLRSRDVTAFTRAQLNELRASAAADQRPEFFAALFRALQEQLGEKLRIPASGITEATASQNLPQLGAPDELTAQIERFFHWCNEARYGPGAGGQDLRTLLREIEPAFDELQKLPPRASA